MSETSRPAGAPVSGDTAPRRVLLVAAHPDDIDFGAAGTVATLTASGAEVAYCIVTDGDAGGSDPSVARTEMAAIRRDEQRRAGEVLGVREITFLGYPDGRLTPSLDLRRDIARVIRAVRPERLLCPSPERDFARLGVSHPDHLAAGEAALGAAYPDARNPFAFPELLAEGLEPHAVDDIWLMGHPEAGVVVDITDAIDKKVEALRAHASQIGRPDELAAMVRDWAAATAQRAGQPAGRLAEAFGRASAW